MMKRYVCRNSFGFNSGSRSLLMSRKVLAASASAFEYLYDHPRKSFSYTTFKDTIQMRTLGMSLSKASTRYSEDIKV